MKHFFVIMKIEYSFPCTNACLKTFSLNILKLNNAFSVASTFSYKKFHYFKLLRDVRLQT